MPTGMHSDHALELIKGQFSTLLQKYCIRQTTTEPNSPWKNRAEGQGTKPIKKVGTWLMERDGTPLPLWNYTFELAASIDNIRYVNVGRLRRAEGLAVYYPLGLSVPNGWSARY